MNKKCYYCEKEFGSITYHGIILAKTKDHIVPLSRGGKMRGLNVVHCCHYCNKLKDDMMPAEFMEFLESLMNNTKGTKLPKDQLMTMIHQTRCLDVLVSIRPDQYIKLACTKLNDQFYKIPKPILKIENEFPSGEIKKESFLKPDWVAEYNAMPEPNFHESE